LKGGAAKPKLVPTLPVSTAAVGTQLADGDDVLFANSSYIDIGGWYRYDAKSRAVHATPLRQKSLIDTSTFERLRTTATSKDGTAVPMSLLQRKGTAKNGQNPAVLNAYGGYGVSQRPGYSRDLLPLVEQGFVVAIANLRGGGEFGESWHLGGNLTH